MVPGGSLPARQYASAARRKPGSKIDMPGTRPCLSHSCHWCSMSEPAFTYANDAAQVHRARIDHTDAQAARLRQRRDVRVPLLDRADAVDGRVEQRVGSRGEHGVPALAVARRRVVTGAEHVDVVVHHRGAGVEARQRGAGDLLGRAGSVGVGAVDRRLDDDGSLAEVVAHGRADGRTTSPTLPASVASPSTRIGVPLTSTCVHADGRVGGEALGVGREVAHPPHRTGGDGVGIEHRRRRRTRPDAGSRGRRSRRGRPAAR